jgi:hypothetical protein
VFVSGDVAYVANWGNGLVCVKVRECGSDDVDFDGLGYLEEVLNYGTKPHDSDSDDDGYSDGIEVDAGTDPLDPKDHPTPEPQDNTLMLLMALLSPSPEAGIPGYNILILLSVFGVLILTVIWAKKCDYNFNF